MVNSVNPLKPLHGDAGAAQDAPVAPAAEGASAAPVDPAYAAKVTKAAIDFESFFISNMLHQMRETTRDIAPDDSPFKDKVNQDMQDMADKLLAGNVASQRAFGIADAILRQMLPAAATPKKST
jgi:flagellar protein FlgJ